MSFLQPTLGLSPKLLPYIFLVLSCFVIVFVFSQLPLLMTVFSPESGLNPENFYKRRSFWYFVLILVASFLSPPDFWLQFSIAFFLCSLFECLVLVRRLPRQPLQQRAGRVRVLRQQRRRREVRVRLETQNLRRLVPRPQ